MPFLATPFLTANDRYIGKLVLVPMIGTFVLAASRGRVCTARKLMKYIRGTDLCFHKGAASGNKRIDGKKEPLRG